MKLHITCLNAILLCLAVSVSAQNKKTIVLTFDDAAQSHYSFVAPLLKQLGFGATFYVCEFPGVYPDSNKAMNWRQIAELSHMGFEIGNHTQTHTTLTLNNEEELSYLEKKCDSLGIPKPATYAYPGYDEDTACFPLLRKHGYTTARSGGNKPYSIKKDPVYLVPSYAIHNDSGDLFYEALKQAGNGKVIVFTFHGVPDEPHPWVSTSQSKFTEYMQYLKDHQYRVIAMKDLQYR